MAREGVEGEGRSRPIVYCVVPRLLAGRLHDQLRKHFAEDQTVEVVVERREGERRRAPERRAESPEPYGRRRLIRNVRGRRVADRRATAVAVSPPAGLPRRARAHAGELVFLERFEPSSEAREDQDTARLVARIQAGDREAFGSLYLRYFDRVYGYLRVVFDDAHEAEDLTQHVFMRLLEDLPRYEFRGKPFRAWLFVVVRNAALTQLKRHERFDVVDPDDLGSERERAGAEASADGDDRLEVLDWITDRELMMFVERLPALQRQVLVLRYVLDLSAREVAEVLGASPNHVAVLQYRALGYLRDRLAAVGRDTPQRGDKARMRRVFRKAPVLRSRRFALTGLTD